MKELEFRKLYKEREISCEKTDTAVQAVLEMEKYLKSKDIYLDTVSLPHVKEYILQLISNKKNDLDTILALGRYFYITGQDDVYIYFTSISGGRTVLASISERLALIVSEEKAKKIFDGIKAPELGLHPSEFPPVTAQMLMNLKKELSPDLCKKILAGNHHRIPVEGFKGKKDMFNKAATIDEFLRQIHGSAVDELDEYCREKKVWYEQIITPGIVDYVRGNQELLSGVRKGNKIYITKFPYAPSEYLNEKDPLKKRYFMCHCPLARESILDDKVNIDDLWCYCSGGYEKLIFDVVFEQGTEVEVLENAIGGSHRCRFAVTIPEGKMK